MSIRPSSRDDILRRKHSFSIRTGRPAKVSSLTLFIRKSSEIAKQSATHFTNIAFPVLCNLRHSGSESIHRVYPIHRRCEWGIRFRENALLRNSSKQRSSALALNHRQTYREPSSHFHGTIEIAERPTEPMEDRDAAAGFSSEMFEDFATGVPAVERHDLPARCSAGPQDARQNLALEGQTASMLGPAIQPDFSDVGGGRQELAEEVGFAVAIPDKLWVQTQSSPDPSR
mgnify:FL=1